MYKPVNSIKIYSLKSGIIGWGYAHTSGFWWTWPPVRVIHQIAISSVVGDTPT